MGEGKVRMNVQVSPELGDIVDQIAQDTRANTSEVFRQALALMKVAHDAKKNAQHIGLVADATKLDTEIVGLF